MLQRNQNGFTLAELLVVVSIVILVAGVSAMNILPAIRNARVERAYQNTLMQMRRTRQAAIDERRVHVITFTAPRTIQIQRRELDDSLTPVSQLNLSEDIRFTAEPGIPTGSAATPDGFGVGTVAIDFNGAAQIFFQPDGSARDVTGGINNGVVYLARPPELTSSRAVTLFGATGRIKGWRLTNQGGESVVWR